MMKTIEALEGAHARKARPLWVMAGTLVVFVAGLVVGRLSVDVSPDRTSKQSKTTPVTETSDAPVASVAIAQQTKKATSREVEQMAEGAMVLDRFADSAKLMNVLREDYPSSHEAQTLRDVRHLLHPESRDEPYTERDARDLRSALDALKTIRAKYPYLSPEKQRATEAILGRAFLESKAADADAALNSLKSLKRATDDALRGE
jgi:hypothetical protein